MATRRYNIPIHQDISTRYPSDLNDQEFDLIAPQVAQKAGSGKKRTVDIREILNAIFYRTRTVSANKRWVKFRSGSGSGCGSI